MKEGWVNKKLWEILVFDKRFNGISKEKQKKVASFVHVSAEKLKELKVDEGSVRLISTGLFDGFTTEELAGDYLNKGEIITIPTGGVANIKYYEGKFVDSGNIIGIAGVKDVKMKYVYYFLLFKKEAVDSFFRGVGIKHPYMPDICEMSIPFPTEKEQEKIILQLDLLQSIIDKQQVQLKELDSLAQAIFYDMFGDPVENEKGWDLKTMEDVCLNIVDCPHSTPKKSDKRTNYPCIRTSELKEGSIYWDSMQYLEEDEYKIRIARLKPIAGDIVFGREGTIGDAVILPDGYNFSLGQRTMLLRVDDSSISNIFLQRVILSECVKKQIRMVNVSSTVPHVNIKDFKQFEILVPPLALQHSFAEKILAIEKQKANISKSIEETQKLFDYTMDKYFG